MNNVLLFLQRLQCAEDRFMTLFAPCHIYLDHSSALALRLLQHYLETETHLLHRVATAVTFHLMFFDTRVMTEVLLA